MFENYKNEIKKQFIHLKENDLTGFFDNLTPAECRNRCLHLYDTNNLSEDDKNILCLFFETNEGESLRKSIDHSKIDKFRPIISFLKGEKNSENRLRINLAAILVDFNPRPFARYTVQPNENIETNPLQDLKNEKANETTNHQETDLPTKIIADEPKSKKTNWLKKNITYIITGTVFFIAIFLGMNHFLTNKKSIVWINDHYEEVDDDKKTYKGPQSIIDEELLKNFKKIIPCDTTSHIKNGKACLWYGKSAKGDVEFFTALGFHPETGKTLKEVTNHIMTKYGKGPCN